MANTDYFLFNGVNRRTGRLHAQPFESGAERIKTMWVPSAMDRNNLAQTGWAYVLAKSDPQREEILECLAPLIDKRNRESHGGARLLSYVDGMDAVSFKKINKSLYGPTNLKKIPYYVLLIGSPQVIPFSFQSDLSSTHAVGRLHFDFPQQYALYAQSVLEAESAAKRPRRAVFWAADHPGDESSKICSEHLTAPLVEEIGRQHRDFEIVRHFGSEASKSVLDRILRDEAPAFLFTSGHGLFFSAGDRDQRGEQGALVCGNWEGPGRGLPNQDKFFAAADVGNADLAGMISFHFACNSAGTPLLDNFYFRTDPQKRMKTAELPFVSRLAQTMLGKASGRSLAFIGHVERTWLNTFLWRPNEEKPQQYSDVIGKILRGERIGAAFELFSTITAEISASLMGRILEAAGPLDPRIHAIEELGQISDLRGFVIIGDPAVRLSGAPPQPDARDSGEIP